MLIVVFFLLTTLLSAVDLPGPFNKAVNIINQPLPDLVGETLAYSISLNNISLGQQILTFESIINYQGRSAYVVTFNSQPNLMMKALNYKNNEKYYLDAETLLPLYIFREYSGGFDKGSMEFYFREKTCEVDVFITEKASERRFSTSVTEPFQGETTFILFSRFVDLKKTPLIEIISSTGKNYFQLFSGHEEKVTVPAGSFQAELALINFDAGRIWLSKDIFRVPLKIILNINAGRLEMHLLSIKRQKRERSEVDKK